LFGKHLVTQIVESLAFGEILLLRGFLLKLGQMAQTIVPCLILGLGTVGFRLCELDAELCVLYCDSLLISLGTRTGCHPFEP
jgi:hypothetical protein